MKKLKAFFLTAILALVCGCVLSAAEPLEFSGMKFESYSIKTITPTSFTSLDGVVSITLQNGFGRISFSNVTGIIYKGGLPFVIGKADDFSLTSGKQTLDISGQVSLESMTVLMSILQNPTINPDDYTFDVKATVKYRGRTIPVEKKGIPLSRILHRIN